MEIVIKLTTTKLLSNISLNIPTYIIITSTRFLITFYMISEYRITLFENFVLWHPSSQTVFQDDVISIVEKNTLVSNLSV